MCERCGNCDCDSDEEYVEFTPLTFKEKIIARLHFLNWKYTEKHNTIMRIRQKKPWLNIFRARDEFKSLCKSWVKDVSDGDTTRQRVLWSMPKGIPMHNIKGTIYQIMDMEIESLYIPDDGSFDSTNGNDLTIVGTITTMYPLNVVNTGTFGFNNYAVATQIIPEQNMYI